MTNIGAKLANILDPIDPQAFMTDAKENGGIRISNSAIAILLFLFAQTTGAVWWASSMNEKMNQFNTKMAEQATAVTQQRNADVEDIKEVKQQIEFLKTYNQRTREQFAAHGWVLDDEGTLTRRR